MLLSHSFSVPQKGIKNVVSTRVGAPVTIFAMKDHELCHKIEAFNYSHLTQCNSPVIFAFSVLNSWALSMWKFVHHLLIIHGPLQLCGLLSMVFLLSLMTSWKEDGTKETAVKENTQLERKLTQVWKWAGLWITMKASRHQASWKVGSGPAERPVSSCLLFWAPGVYAGWGTQMGYFLQINPAHSQHGCELQGETTLLPPLGLDLIIPVLRPLL